MRASKVSGAVEITRGVEGQTCVGQVTVRTIVAEVMQNILDPASLSGQQFERCASALGSAVEGGAV